MPSQRHAPVLPVPVRAAEGYASMIFSKEWCAIHSITARGVATRKVASQEAKRKQAKLADSAWDTARFPRNMFSPSTWPTSAIATQPAGHYGLYVNSTSFPASVLYLDAHLSKLQQSKRAVCAALLLTLLEHVTVACKPRQQSLNTSPKKFILRSVMLARDRINDAFKPSVQSRTSQL